MDLPIYNGNFGPVAMEADAYNLRIRGALPPELSGELYRNGPNPQFSNADPRNHWFTGDGMIHSVAIEGGRARYRNRWVRTPKWLAEHDAGRALFAGFSGTLPDAPAIANDSGVANTNIVWHADKLLALEEGHPPTEMSRRTLETRGYVDFPEASGTPFTAHPKLDPVTGELVFFGYGVGTAALSRHELWNAGCVGPHHSLRPLQCSLFLDGTRFHRYKAACALPDPAAHRQPGTSDAWKSLPMLGSQTKAHASAS